jgi:hypothetical protein
MCRTGVPVSKKRTGPSSTYDQALLAAQSTPPIESIGTGLDKLSILTADKGYDWELLRHKLRSEGV